MIRRNYKANRAVPVRTLKTCVRHSVTGQNARGTFLRRTVEAKVNIESRGYSANYPHSAACLEGRETDSSGFISRRIVKVHFPCGMNAG